MATGMCSCGGMPALHPLGKGECYREWVPKFLAPVCSHYDSLLMCWRYRFPRESHAFASRRAR